MSFAKIHIHGNLGADAETKYTPNGAMVVELRIAVNDRRDDTNTTWYRISAWDRLADRLDKLATGGHLSKGSSLYVVGQLTPRPFQGNDGSSRISFDVTMLDFDFTGGGGQRDQNGDTASAPAQAAPQQTQTPRGRGSYQNPL
jgi:single-strand DNA-binding protein